MIDRDWSELIQRHLDGNATADEVAALSASMETDADARLMYLRLARVHAALAAAEFDETTSRESDERLLDLMDRLDRYEDRRRARRSLTALGLAAATIALIVGGYFVGQRSASTIATITAVDGAVRWTGDGGQVDDDPKPGQPLGGGVVESLSVDSSMELLFGDGSTVTISGVSAMTISDDGQKELHLREGHLSVNLERQRANKPLILSTSTARLATSETRCAVAADSRATKVTVTKGTVHATRLTDGQHVNVMASQRVVTTMEARGKLAVRPVRLPVHAWTADLATDVSHGKWLSDERAAGIELRRAVANGEMTSEEAGRQLADRVGDFQDDAGVAYAVPMRLGSRDVTYAVSIDVSPGQPAPVVLVRGSRLRIQGRVRQPAEVKFGFSAIDPRRQGGGRYMKSFAHGAVAETFDLTVPIEQFKNADANARGDSVFGREFVNVFCFTSSREAELVITNVELLAP